jgi:hypothetical protein
VQVPADLQVVGILDTGNEQGCAKLNSVTGCTLRQNPQAWVEARRQADRDVLRLGLLGCVRSAWMDQPANRCAHALVSCGERSP